MEIESYIWHPIVEGMELTSGMLVKNGEDIYNVGYFNIHSIYNNKAILCYVEDAEGGCYEIPITHFMYIPELDICKQKELDFLLTKLIGEKHVPARND